MHVRGRDVWPAPLTADLVGEQHFGRRMLCYPPERPRTLGDLLARAVDRCPDAEAVVDRAERLTWRELRSRARRLATGLHLRHGVKPGDRVALLLPNTTAFCVGVFACLELGAVAVALNTKLKSRELEFMLDNSGARVLLLDAERWREIEPIRARIPCEAYYVVGPPVPGTGAFAGLLDTERPPVVSVGEEATAFILYTSGTTGRPKGAEATHLGIVSSVVTLARTMGLGPGERSLVAVPLFHVTGLIAQFLTMAYVGGTSVLMPAFDAADALSLLDAERITHIIAAPTVFVMMMTRPEHVRHGRTVRVVGYGGAPISAETVRGLRAWLPAARLHNAYGLTETSSPTTVLPDADALARVSTVGLPIPTAEVRTVEPGGGAECGAGEVGELLVWGPMVVPRYWANPDATAVTMGDGWLRTGDLARIDGDGYVTVMDRLKDMINRGGEKVYCVEVEEVLCAHPDLLEVAVVGVPDPVYGEAVKAAVVPRPGRSVDPADVRRWVTDRLAKFKAPRDVVVLPALPRNPNGKVIKTALRESV